MTLTRPLALAATGLALALTACGAPSAAQDAGSAPASAARPGSPGAGSASTSAGPLTVTDCGKSVTLAERPRKVLTVGSAAVSLLDAAGASDRITARSGEFNAPLPSGLAHPPTSAKVVDPSDPSTEAILGTDADLVYGYGLFNAKAADLTKAGVDQLTVTQECGHDAGDTGPGAGLASIPAEIRRLGTAFGTQEAAERSATAFEDGLESADRSKQKAGRAAWVYYFSPSEPLSAYGRPGIPGDILTRAGLTNVFAVDKPYISTNVEALLKQDPDWIVLGASAGQTSQQALAHFTGQKGADQLTAVKRKHVVVVGPDAGQPSPTSLDGLRRVAGAVHGR